LQLIVFTLSLRTYLLKFVCRLRDWRKATDIIKLMEPSLHLVSVGTINHLLHFLGKSGKMEIMMKVVGKYTCRYISYGLMLGIMQIFLHILFFKISPVSLSFKVWYLRTWFTYANCLYPCSALNSKPFYPKIQLFYRFVALGSSVNISTYSILLKNLLSFGNWRKYIEVRFMFQ